MKPEYEVTFHFTSGETMIVTYSKEKLDEMWNTIKKAWNHCCVASDEWGINFSQVTHYRVKKIN